MNKSLVIILVIVVLLAVAGVFVYSQKSGDYNIPPTSNPSPNSSQPTSANNNNQSIDQSALDRELNQIDQDAQSSNDNDSSDLDTLNSLTQ